jgi:hypothetical protein
MTEGKGSCGCGGSGMHAHDKEDNVQNKEMQENRTKGTSNDVDMSEETGKMGGSDSDSMRNSEQTAK